MIGEEFVVADIFEAPEQRMVFIQVPIRLCQKRGQGPPRITILGAERRSRGQSAAIGVVNASSRAMLVLAGVNQEFGVLEIAMANLRRPARRWVPRCAHRPAVEARLLDIPALLVRLAPGEDRSFELELACRHSRRCDAIGDVRRIEPVMRDRRLRIVARATAMHKRARPQRRLADRTAVEEQAGVLADIDVDARRQLHEQIVRMLTIDQRFAVIGLAGRE